MAYQTLRVERFSSDTPDARVAAIAARQHGVITFLQLLRAGLDRHAIRRRVNNGRLYRLYHGVYAVGHTGLSDRGRMLAAVLACGEGAALSHFHAASLCDVSRFPLPSLIDVVVPRQRRPGKPIRAHESRTLRREDVTTRHNIPVTRIPRTLIDLADVLTPHQLANIIHQAAFRGLFAVAPTRDAMARANGRRLKTLERAIELHLSGSAGTRSGAEDAFLRGLDDEPLVNTHLVGEEVDFHWPDRQLVVEIDGPGHGRPAAMRDDARRDAKLRKAGYTVLRVSDQDVWSGAAHCLIRRTYASG